jgi:hypothetical protein
MTACLERLVGFKIPMAFVDRALGIEYESSQMVCLKSNVKNSMSLVRRAPVRLVQYF